MKVSVCAAVILATASLASAVPASAQAFRVDPAVQAGASPLLETVQFRPGQPRFLPRPGIRPGGFHGLRQWARGNEYRHRGYGIGAGVAGLAAGAIIGGALASQAAPAYVDNYDEGYAYPPPPVSRDADAYCAQRFKSYNPASGTYLGYDGQRHPCP